MKYFAAVILSLWCLYLHADISVQNNEPITKFYLPIFGDSGYKTCELTGLHAEFINDDNIDITDVLIKCLSGDEAGLVQMTIEGPHATVLPDKNLAYNQCVMFLAGDKFTGMCADWEFYASENRIIGKKDVRVLFEESISDFLQEEE